MKKIKIVREQKIVNYFLNLIGKDEAYILGGFAKHVCSPEKSNIKNISDIDIYCKDEEVFKKMREKLKEAKFEEHKKEYTICIMYTKKNPFNIKIQLIKPIEDLNVKTMGSLEDILNNFDFSVARVGILNKEEALCDDDFEEHEKKKLCVLKFIHCPVSSTIRLMKYAKKGYKVRPREVFKLFRDWDNRPKEYKDKLYELFDKIDILGDDGKTSATEKEIEELERLLRRD